MNELRESPVETAVGGGRPWLRHAGGLLLPLLLAAATGRLSAGSLLHNPTFQAGEGPSSIVTADFNHDGRPDLAVANTYSDDLSIFLGRGDGTFGRPRQYMAGPRPLFVVQADLDSNGSADLAVVHNAGVSLFLGHGDGTFDLLDTLRTGTNPNSVAAGDFNQDGLPDLLVSNAGQAVCGYDSCLCEDASIAVLLNLGNSRFTLRRLPVGGTNCAAEIVAGDFNQDGHQDIVLTLALYGDPDPENLSLFPGLGDGAFGPETRPAHLTVGTSLDSGDFDEDGRLDLAVESFSPSWTPQVQILRGTGDGRFTLGAAYPSPNTISDIAVGDQDGDGHLDVIVSNGDDEILRLLGHGDGAFTPLPGVVGGYSLAQLAVEDFNGDSRPDVAVVSRSRSLGVSVLLGQPSGGLGTPDLSLPQEANTRAMISADFNNDHRPDLAMINEQDRTLTVLSGNGDGTFRFTSRSPTGFNPYALAAGDLNGDGFLDVAVANLGSWDVSVLIGSGTGYFQGLPRFPAGRNPRGVAIGRFDADSYPDLVVANQTSDDISVLLGLGYGLMGPQSRYPVHSDPFSASTGDFDGNGLDDIAVANYLGCNCLSLFRSRGDGTLSLYAEPPAGARPTSVTTTDLDRDGRLDLVVTNDQGGGGGRISILTGRGDGSFETARQVALGDQPLSLAVADFNGDGLPDLATADRAANDIAVLLATGPGQFSRAMRFGVGREPWSIAAADFNSDGRADVAVLDYISGDLRVLLNQGSANHSPVAGASVGGDFECSSPRGSMVELDASRSADPDSTPGTNDDILSFQWYENYQSASEKYLGPGEQLEVALPVGAHSITLVATDSWGSVSTSSTLVQVTDTTPPSLAVRLSRAILWPPDRRMVDILADVASDDACGEPSVALLQVLNDESGEVQTSPRDSGSGDIQDADVGTLDLRFRLRAERYGGGAGRIYTVTYQASDRSGNVSTVDAFVYVPASLAQRELPERRGTPRPR